LPAAGARPAPENHPVERTALAPQLVEDFRTVVADREVEAKPSPTQGSLFGPAAFRPRDGSKVIPFDGPAPPPSRESAPKVHTTTNGRRQPAEGQQRLRFPQPNTSDEDRRTDDGHIYCDAPVAIPVHRALAAFVDASMVIISCGLFLGIFYGIGAQVVLTRQTMPFYGAAVVVVAAFYFFMWCVAGTDSLGMRWARLHLLNFDGDTPTRQQRLTRFASAWLSVGAGCMGLMWSLVDEERLTWHDHMSKTFPTPGKPAIRYPVGR
jgi:uncharacterized RDD family membrane protein YckC